MQLAELRREVDNGNAEMRGEALEDRGVGDPSSDDFRPRLMPAVWRDR